MVVTNMFVYFHPYLGEMIPVDENIFQMGWFNPPTREHEPLAHIVPYVLCDVTATGERCSKMIAHNCSAENRTEVFPAETS